MNSSAVVSEPKLSIPKVITVPPEFRALEGRDGNVIPPTRNPVYRGYRLTDEVSNALKRLADPKHYRCAGSGVKDWRANGLKARICSCVQAKAASLDAQDVEAVKALPQPEAAES